MENRKLSKAEKRRIELEEWIKTKNESRKLMKNFAKPPFFPVGKSTIMNNENNNKYSTNLKSNRINKTYKTFSSTPFVEHGKKSIPKPFKKSTNVNSDKTKVYIATPIKPDNICDNKYNNQRSVQFKENVIEIPPEINDTFDKSVSNSKDIIENTPQISQINNSDIRRISYAGSTPFSCTNSRSGSTPGRRDIPNTLNDETLNEIFGKNDNLNTPRLSNTSRSRSKSVYPVCRWSVRKDSILKRDPYPLRSHTSISKLDFTVIDTPNTNKSNNLKHKDFKVSFGGITINEVVQSSNDDSVKSNETFNILKPKLFDISTLNTKIDE